MQRVQASAAEYSDGGAGGGAKSAWDETSTLIARGTVRGAAGLADDVSEVDNATMASLAPTLDKLDGEWAAVLTASVGTVDYVADDAGGDSGSGAEQFTLSAADARVTRKVPFALGMLRAEVRRVRSGGSIVVEAARSRSGARRRRRRLSRQTEWLRASR